MNEDDLQSIVFARGGGHVLEVRPNAGRETPAPWRVRLHDPSVVEETQDMPGLNDAFEQTFGYSARLYSSIFDSSYARRDPGVSYLEHEQLLSNLTVDEKRYMMGYCAHLVEHSQPHVQELYKALGEALHDHEVVEKLNDELEATMRTAQVAGDLARLVLEQEVTR